MPGSTWPACAARNTGPDSCGSSGERAIAVPTRAVCGHGPAACWASEHERCSASRLTPIPAGSVTAAVAVLALPGGPVITVRSAGVLAVLIVASSWA